MSDDISILDELFDDLGIVNKDETPEEKLYREVTDGKHPKMISIHYWFKHEWHVYNRLLGNNWLLVKPNGPTRTQVSAKELSRAFLAYYFRMTMLPRFEGEDAKRRGSAVNMDQFLDLVLEEPTIKKIIDNPSLLV